MMVRMAMASAWLLATPLPALSLVYSVGDADSDWDDWLQMSKHQPEWFDEWRSQNDFWPLRQRRQPKWTSQKDMHRVAVFCSGMLKRFFLRETASGLIAPLAKEGHTVHYYLALNMGDLKSFHPGADKLAQDPKFNGKTEDAVRQMINRTVNASGGLARKITLFNDVDINDSDRHWLASPSNNMLGKENVLKKLKPLQTLYQEAEMVEKAKGWRYDFMIFLDDDAIWLRPFSLTNLLKKTKQHKEKQLFSLNCGPGSTTITPESGFLTEYIFVAARNVSDAIGKQYAILTGSGIGNKVYNLEQFSYRVAAKTGADIIQVPPAAIPMQRAGRILKNGKMTVCLHKKCLDWPNGRGTHGNFSRMDPLKHHHVCQEALWKR